MKLRSRLTAPLLAVVAALVLAQYARVWLAIPTGLARTSDFAGTYAAATLWRGGDAARMYDSAAEERVLRRTGSPADHLDIPFENPPSAAVLAVPFSLIDSSSAYRLWSLLQLLMVGAGTALVAAVAPWPSRTPRSVRAAIALVAFAGFGTGALWVEGQWDGLSVLGLSLGYWAWRRDRSMLAGVAIGLGAAVAKPHLVLGVLAFIAGRRDWRAALGAGCAAVAAALATLAAAGPAPLVAFASLLLTPRYSPTLEMQSIPGLAGSWLGVSGASGVIALVLMVGALGVAARLGSHARGRPDSLEPALAGATALSLLAAPHLLSHDLVLLAPALVFSVAWLARRATETAAAWPDARAVAALAAWGALSLASLHDLGDSSQGPPGRLTPIALTLVAAACCTVAFRDRGGTRSAQRGSVRERLAAGAR